MSGLEVLGALASIGQVLGQIDSCYGYMQKLQRAPKELQELIGELATSRAIFVAAKKQLEALPPPERTTIGAADEWVTVVAGLAGRADAKINEIYELTKRNSAQNGSKIHLQRLHWVLSTSRVAQLCSSLASIRAEYSVALGVANSSQLATTSHRFDELVAKVEGISLGSVAQLDLLGSLTTAVKHMCQTLEDCRADVKQPNSLVTLNISDSEIFFDAKQHFLPDSPDLPDLTLDSPPPPYSSVAEELGSLAVRRGSSASLQSLPTRMTPVETRMSRTPKQCHGGCRCVCHRSRRLTTPRFLRTLTGSWSATVAGWNFVAAACNMASCKRSTGTTVHVAYVFPNWVLSKAFLFYMESGPMIGTDMRLKPRNLVMTDAFRLAQTGDVQGLHELYMRGGASKDDLNPQEGQSALLTAVWCGQVEVVRYLLDRNAPKEEQTFDGLETTDAVLRHVYGKVSSPVNCALLAHLFNLEDVRDEQQFTILHKIVLGLAHTRNLEDECREHRELVNFTDLRGRSPLWWAALRQDYHACVTLLAYDADPNNFDYQGETVMQNAAGTTCTEIVRLLLDAKADISPGNGVAETPLHYAARSDSRIETVALLLERGSDPNATNANGVTPFHECIESDAVQVASLLCKYGTALNQRKTRAERYVHMAIRCRAIRVLSLLVSKSCDLSVLDHDGQTILHAAARFGDENAVLVLAKVSLLGVDTQLRDSHGKRALDYLEERWADVQPEDAEYAATLKKSLTSLIESVGNANQVIEEVQVSQDKFYDPVGLAQKANASFVVTEVLVEVE